MSRPARIALTLTTQITLLLYAFPLVVQEVGETTEHFTGTLESGWAAIGGEHTGWVLRNEDEAGSSIEVDVSCCAVQATALDGTRITVTGRWIDKQYVELGTVRILMAERVEAADG